MTEPMPVAEEKHVAQPSIMKNGEEKCFSQPKRLYQTIGEQLRQQIFDGRYKVGDKLPPERLISEEFNVSRTVVREAIIMLELDALVAVRKGSGIHVIADAPASQGSDDEPLEQKVREILTEIKKAGPFEMLQARQLVECMIAAFAATQVTKQDIVELTRLQELGHQEDQTRDSVWDREFHLQIARATNNSVLAMLVELMWYGRESNPLWTKLHEHIDPDELNSWHQDHSEILKSLIRKDASATQKAMWQHIENTRQALYNASSASSDDPYDKYLFQDDPLLSVEEA